MNEILVTLQAQPWWSILSAVVTLCSVICAATPTPAPGSKLAAVYKIFDWCALNIGKAKQNPVVPPVDPK